jgi:hypothetical protein
VLQAEYPNLGVLVKLKHKSAKTVRLPPEECRKCLLDLEGFMSRSKYTYAVKKMPDGTYEVVFRWRKLGVERFYRVRLRVEGGGDLVEYRSTEYSDYPFLMRFLLEPGPDGSTRVHVESEMDAGIMAGLLGKGDYRAFVEELVEKGIASLARRYALTRGASPAPGQPAAEEASAPRVLMCRECILYDPERGYCYALRTEVKDPERPPCRGKYMVPRVAPIS